MAYYAYCKHIRNKTGNYPKYVHTDGGGEFIDKEVKAYNTKRGITHTYTSPLSSQQNPIAERVNRTIGEGSLSLLTTANLPSSFWEYAVSTFMFIRNRAPHKSLSLSNPLTEWNIYNKNESNIDIYDLRIFGSEAYVLDEYSRKNQPKAFRCIYLGPSSTHKGSNFYNLHTKKFMISRNFVINEQVFPGKEYYPDLYDRNFGTPPDLVITTPSNSPVPTTTYDTSSIPFVSNCYTVPSISNTITTPSVSISTVPSVSISENIVNNNVPIHVPVSTSPNINNTSPSINNIYKPIYNNDVPPHPHIVEPAEPGEPNSPEPAPDTNREILEVSNTTPFDRDYRNKEGAGGLPSLDLNSKNNSDLSPNSQNVPDSPGEQDTINGEPAYEVSEITGKRKTKFRVLKEGPWNETHGYDYQVRWSTGETTWEPESSLAQAPDLVENFENDQLPSSHPDVDEKAPSPSSEAPPEASNLTNICNFVHIALFSHLTKFYVRDQPSWKNFKVPDSRKEMLESPQKDFWIKAEEEEMKQLLENQTWKNFRGKPPKKAITCRWVYKIKPPTSIQPEPIFKARLVAHGYKQTAHLDYGATFAQVATMKAFRLFVWMSVVFRYKASQLDFTSAFLQGKIDKEIYMTGPPGHSNEGEVVLLQKSIYGVRQAPRIWYQTLIAHLQTLGFRELVSDTCVMKHETEKFFILIFVDDLILLTKNDKMKKEVEDNLKQKFSLKILGKLKHFVGYQIDHKKDGSIHLHQNDYAQKIIDTFNTYLIPKYKPSTPFDHKQKFSTKQQPTNDRDKQNMAKYPYRQLIGSLLYLLGTRPELYFIIITLSRYVCNPGWIHWLSALYVLMYVKQTTALGIRFVVNQKFRLSVYVDADWGSNVDDRKSISGYIIYLGNTPIVWKARSQKGKPATSSCEAEYISLSSVINEIVWIIAFFKELGFNIPLPVAVYCDNRSANDLAYNPVHHDRTKHIDISYHRIREFILDGTIQIHHVRSENNPADLFTKCVSPTVFKRLINFVYNCNSSLPD